MARRAKHNEKWILEKFNESYQDAVLYFGWARHKLEEVQIILDILGEQNGLKLNNESHPLKNRFIKKPT